MSLTVALARLADLLAADTPPDPERASAALLEPLLAAVPAARWVSVTEELGEQPSARMAAQTPAASGPVALAADELQYAAGEGPCLDAARGAVVLADHEQFAARWPVYASRAMERTPVRSVLSHPVPTQGRRTSINFYSDAARGFAASDVEAAAEAAAVWRVAALAVAVKTKADNLALALQSSRQIAAAVGIVMVGLRCTYDEAFAAITVVSQRTHRKIRDLADEIVLTGTLPEPT